MTINHNKSSVTIANINHLICTCSMIQYDHKITNDFKCEVPPLSPVLVYKIIQSCKTNKHSAHCRTAHCITAHCYMFLFFVFYPLNYTVSMQYIQGANADVYLEWNGWPRGLEIHSSDLVTLNWLIL